MEIKDIIARRSDLGSFVVHLTRDMNGKTAASALDSILKGKKIEARSPFGSALALLKKKNLPSVSQNCVCFTETPLQYLHLLVESIKGRNVKFAPYGVAITKKLARKLGANPIWYIDTTPRQPMVDWLTKNTNALIQKAIDDGSFDSSDIAKLAPFWEQMGSWGTTKKEFWWEREWRHIGAFSLPQRLIVLCPSAEIKKYRKVCETSSIKASFLDPHWGLEQIVASLAGFEPKEVEML